MKIEPKSGCDQYDQRWVITDDDGKVVDDAQGYGYKSKQKAAKALWYKFKDGKSKINKNKQEKNAFFKQHKGLSKFLNKIYEDNFKELYRGEVTEQDIIDEVKEKFGINIPKSFLSGPE